MTATAERVVLDTDVVSRLQDGSLPVALRAKLAGMSLLVSFITIGELFRGAVHAGWGPRRVAALERWLEFTTTIPGEERVARAWGEITGAALRAGKPLPANDAWIAACCVAHGLPLATLNRRDFAQVAGLRLVGSA